MNYKNDKHEQNLMEGINGSSVGKSLSPSLGRFNFFNSPFEVKKS